jgi:hypothetical protein
MTSFEKLYQIAVSNYGSMLDLEAALPMPKTDEDLEDIPDDRYLSMMTRCVFRAGFVWRR